MTTSTLQFGKYLFCETCMYAYLDRRGLRVSADGGSMCEFEDEPGLVPIMLIEYKNQLGSMSLRKRRNLVLKTWDVDGVLHGAFQHIPSPRTSAEHYIAWRAYEMAEGDRFIPWRRIAVGMGIIDDSFFFYGINGSEVSGLVNKFCRKTGKAFPYREKILTRSQSRKLHLKHLDEERLKR